MQTNRDCPSSLPQEEILRYLGHRPGQELESSLPLLEQAQRLILEQMTPRACVKRLPFSVTERGVNPVGTGLFLTGADIVGHLQNSTECILLCATLGTQVERIINLHSHRDMALAVVLDATATAAIELVCDEVEQELRQQLHAGGEDVTARFSPGYGDLPIGVQNDFLAVMNAQRAIGLCATGNHILIPRKSVTAVMGVVPLGTTRSPRGCRSCSNYENCRFRKEGTTCGISGTAARG